jgi:extracellular factor (EF) 3-hydroxypalmitic acid methyl ester biosynthesis protein
MLAYEELKGSRGREVWVRAPRYDARKLFPQVPPRVCVRSSYYKLHNISLGGLAVLCGHTAEDIPDIGEVVPLSIQQCGYPIFEGNARVARRENNVFGSKIAFSLVNAFIEFDKLLSRNVQARIAAQSPFTLAETGRLVPQEYRAFCADLLKVLGSYRDLLQENQALAQSFHRAFDADNAYYACEARLLQNWRSMWRTGNDLVRGVMADRAQLDAVKNFTEIVITPELRQGAIWDRSYGKPLGYPGDYEVMNQVYDWERSGSSVYQMLLHRVGLDVAECIRTRMEMVLKSIETIVNEKGATRTARIMSLGSGPAREVELFLSKTGLHGRRVEFTLIDQEQAALNYALEKTYPYVLNCAGHANVQCLNLSFLDILRSLGTFGNLPPQDLIYSVGLLDYLVDRRVRSIVQRLYSQLAPGGLLILGNMNETPLSNLWPMEFITDWSLYYRTDADMLGWTEGLDCARAWTENDPTDRVRMLYIQKS